MNGFGLDEMETLQANMGAGVQVAYVGYDPNTVVGDPEGDATALGFSEYYREESANLVEIIYVIDAGGGGGGDTSTMAFPVSKPLSFTGAGVTINRTYVVSPPAGEASSALTAPVITQSVNIGVPSGGMGAQGN